MATDRIHGLDQRIHFDFRPVKSATCTTDNSPLAIGSNACFDGIDVCGEDFCSYAMWVETHFGRPLCEHRSMRWPLCCAGRDLVETLVGRAVTHHHVKLFIWLKYQKQHFLPVSHASASAEAPSFSHGSGLRHKGMRFMGIANSEEDLFTNALALNCRLSINLTAFLVRTPVCAGVYCWFLGATNLVSSCPSNVQFRYTIMIAYTASLGVSLVLSLNGLERLDRFKSFLYPLTCLQRGL